MQVKNMNNIVINHHYIRPDKRYHAITPDQLYAQIKGVQKEYKFISEADLENQIEEPTCLLTFDDGLREHYETVFPILRELEVPALFFVPSVILEKRAFTHVQIRHLLMDKISLEGFAEEINKRVKSPFLKAEGFEGVHGNKRDTPLARGLKMTLDYMDVDERNELLEDIAKNYLDLDEEFEKMYLSINQIQEMRRAGMSFGFHGYTHCLLSSLGFDKKLRELEHGTKIFREKLNFTPKSISYPSSGYDPMVIKILYKLGYQYAFTTKRGVNRNLESPYELYRYDCKDEFVFSFYEGAAAVQ